MKNVISIEISTNNLLPTSYKRFYNNEKLNDFKNIDIETNDGDLVSLIKFMEATEIIASFNENFNVLGYDLLPIANMEYGDIMCLDFRNNPTNPQIIYCNHELALESLEDAITLLFNDFDELYKFLIL